MTLDATPGLEPGRAPPRSLSQARSPGPALPRVLVVGGGFSGVATAVHLSLQAPGPVVIDVVEPQPHLGAGLAYSTADPAHRINVPSSRMGLFPDDEGHFDRWLGQADYLADDPDAATATGVAYPRRLTFGRYVEACVGALGAGRPPVRHLRDRALGVAAAGSGYAVRLASGDVRQADVVVLTSSNPAPEPPRALAAALAGHPRFVANPWAEDALALIRPSDRVLIVGTGLTMADIVASLDRRGHAGPITAISRRGLVSQGHTGDPREPFGDFAVSPAASARDLLRRLRRGPGGARGAGGARPAAPGPPPPP